MTLTMEEVEHRIKVFTGALSKNLPATTETSIRRRLDALKAQRKRIIWNRTHLKPNRHGKITTDRLNASEGMI